MVRAREHRRKVKSERKRGRSNSPLHNESKRQKNAKKRETSLTNSDSEPEVSVLSYSRYVSASVRLPKNVSRWHDPLRPIFFKFQKNTFFLNVKMG